MIPRYLINFELSQLEKKFCNFLIIGSGIAGLFTALKAAPYGDVTILAKGSLDECNTIYAQGGIASVFSEEDSPALHFKDTLEAGAGLCNKNSVKILVSEGPSRVRELIELGVSFDRDNEHYALGREGAHSRNRVLHVGDSTGKAVQEILMDSNRSCKNILIEENVFVVDLLVYESRCVGALAVNKDSGNVLAYMSENVVLATGGLGQLFERTTNSEIATGDGVAMAYRAGAEVMDLEFFQFHPTVFYTPEGRSFLISEAVRGAGGILRNEEEEQFMINYHPLADLGPRDVVTRAIISVLKKTNTKNVFLDLRHLGEDFIRRRFPNIYCTLKDYKIDITRDLIPIVPAAHYIMGGVKTNIYGETNIPGLYAAGEVACTGVHGANRLASNSLLEALVFGDRIVKKALEHNHQFSCRFKDIDLANYDVLNGISPVLDIRQQLKKDMFSRVGIIRLKESLKSALNFIQENINLVKSNSYDCANFELQNMLIVAALMTRAALLREESRGGHFRQDYPSTCKKWLGHLVFSLHRDGKEKANWLGINW